VPVLACYDRVGFLFSGSMPNFLIASPGTLTRSPLMLIGPTRTLIAAPGDLIRATVTLIALPVTLTPSPM